MKTETPLNILISAYACGPNWGSEIGMGWNWVINLSMFCQLTVITEIGFQQEIEEKIERLDLKFKPIFFYIDIGEKGRKLFWEQGSFVFYRYYKMWQKKAFNLALNLTENETYDLIHQLNMIGFREPGYLWKIKKLPFIWGPIGGVDLFPLSFINLEPLKSQIYLLTKNAISYLQFHFSRRVIGASSKATIIFAATSYAQIQFEKKIKGKVILLNETGCHQSMVEAKRKTDNKKIELLWVGRMEGRKALPIALKTIQNIKNQANVCLTIIGDGPQEKYYKTLVKKYNINNEVNWLGRVSNEKVQEVMRNSSILFFTSLREGTPHVVTEAIQNGLPVICHDACGQGAVITPQCGIKIPMINFNQSIADFSKAIIRLCSDLQQLEKLSVGAKNRSHEISWESKADFMFRKYQSIIAKND